MRYLSILAFAAVAFATSASAAVVERGAHVTQWKTSWGWKTRYPKTCKTITEVSTSIEVVPTTVVKFRKEFITITDTETVYITKHFPKFITVVSTEYEQKWGWTTATVTAPCTSVSTVYKIQEHWNYKTVTAPCTSVSTVYKTQEQWAPCTAVSTVWKETTKYQTQTCVPSTYTTTKVGWSTAYNTVTVAAAAQPAYTVSKISTATITDTVTTTLPASTCTPVISTYTVSASYSASS